MLVFHIYIYDEDAVNGMKNLVTRCSQDIFIEYPINLIENPIKIYNYTNKLLMPLLQ